jgi:uncharacterized protein (DUF486 family)
MTFAWYGHLKNLNTKPLWAVILISWGIAFFEYCFQVPGNRIGMKSFTLPQLKMLQECITLVVFVVFSLTYMNIKFQWNHLWSAICLMGAVYFAFKTT